MKAKAKHWVNYNGVWHMTGEEFQIDNADAAEMKLYADLVEENEPEKCETQEQAKRGRKRKTDPEE